MDRPAPDAWTFLTRPAGAAPPVGLHWHPSQIDACLEARAAALPAPLDRAELEELTAAHQGWGADASALESIRRLGRPEARVVIAGQQPGILAGPLYTLYKAIGAIALARRLAARHPELQFVPVFWVASEDHDFDEVRRAFWPGASGQLEEVLIDHPDWRPGRMIGPLSCEPLAASLPRRIEESTFATEFRGAALERLAAAYAPGQTWEAGFCRLLLGLLPETGLVLVSPLMDWVRRRAAPILLRELDAPGATTEAILRRAAELEAQGAEITLHRRPGMLNLFWVDPAQRRHTFRLEGSELDVAVAGANRDADAPDSAAPRTVAALRRRLEAAPAEASLNVVTRPIVQDAILPTVAQLVGPGEAAYFPLVEAACPTLQAFAPVRWPRPNVLLLAPPVERALEKFGIELDQALQWETPDLERRVLERDLRQGVLGEIRAARERQFEELRRLETRSGEDTAVRSAFARLLQAMERGYATIEERMLYARQEDQRHLSQALRRVEHYLRPAGKPQERILNPIVPFTIHFGPRWAGGLLQALSLAPEAGLQIVRLADLPPTTAAGGASRRG